MEDEFIIQLKKDFLNETTDNMSEFQDILDGVGPEGDLDQDNIKEIFRIIHTMKGNSKATGFEAMADMFHNFENILVRVKDGDITTNSKLVDIFYSVLSRVQDAQEIYKSDLEANIDFDDLTNGILEYARIDEECVLQDEVLEQKTQIAAESEVSNIQQAQEAPKSRGVSAPVGLLNIAIIDDELAVREVLIETLDSVFNAEFYEYSDGQDAVDAISKKKFDLILTDFKMPHVNGNKFLEKLRLTDNLNKATPVMFITGLYPEVSDNEAIVKDIYFIQKPFEPNKIIYYARCALVNVYAV